MNKLFDVCPSHADDTSSNNFQQTADIAKNYTHTAVLTAVEMERASRYRLPQLKQPDITNDLLGPDLHIQL